jgi:hypothetical protein
MMIPLERKNTVKYLGLMIDSNLSWKSHIDYISLKLSRIVGIIARIRHILLLSIHWKGFIML